MGLPAWNGPGNRGHLPPRPDRRPEPAAAAGRRALRRLGLVLDQILFHTAGGYSTDEVFVRFVESAASGLFDRIDFCSRARVCGQAAPYPLDPGFFEVTPLPFYADIRSLCLRAPVLLPRIAGALAAVLPRWDLAVACGIHPLTPLILRMARRRGIPAVLWIRGDLGADLRHRLRGPARSAARVLTSLLVTSLPRGTPVISMGRDDYPFLSRMGSVLVAYSSKFEEGDLVTLPRPTRPGGGPPRILYVGRIAPEKGLDVLLDALRRVRNGRRADPRLTIVGSDYEGSSYGPTFRARLASSDLAAFVEMEGHVPFGPRLFAHYDAADLLVLPSHTEGFPQVILEAMARGVPVIATRVGGVPRLVRDGETGLLVPPGDAGALASAIERLLGDPARASGLASRAQPTVRAFTRQVQVARVGRFLVEQFPLSRFATAGRQAASAPPA